MIINAGIIVKDDSELKQLTNAIASIEHYVDGVYITANGEKTEKIKELCETNGFHYSYLKWSDDFAKQRNFNFSQMPKNSDYFFWMDSDDILVGGEHLFEVARIAKEKGKDTVFFTYWYGCKFNGEPSEKTFVEVEMEHMRERLIRPGTHTWIGRLHETPVPLLGSRKNYTAFSYDPKERPVAVMHTASLNKAYETMDRNKRILELQLKEEKERGDVDPRTLLYLIKIYVEEDIEENWLKALDMGEEYIKKSGWDEERGVCWEQMGIIAGKMGDEKKAIEYFHKAIAEWPNQPLTYIRLSQAYYNNKNFHSAKHWLNVASQMDLDNKGGNITNIKAMKVMFAKLLVKINYNFERDIKKALDAARLVYKEEPTKENKDQVDFIADLNDLNTTCDSVNSVCKYLHSIGDDKSIIKLLDALPDAITNQQFAILIRKTLTPSRKWKENEICYLANFGGPHFEKWDGESYRAGIGGSETAVCELSKQFAKNDYKVTVYGDPFNKGEIDGVTYLPWYEFNERDSFNIVIQWRGWGLAKRIKCRKFYVDLHDVHEAQTFEKEQIEFIDKIFVKSKYHRDLTPLIPDDKFIICSNGI